MEYDLGVSYTPTWRGNDKKAEPFKVRIAKFSVRDLDNWRVEMNEAREKSGLEAMGQCLAKAIEGPFPPFKVRTHGASRIIDSADKLCLDTDSDLLNELLAEVYAVQGFKGAREKNSAQPSGGAPTTPTTLKTPASPANGHIEPTPASGADGVLPTPGQGNTAAA